MSRFGPAAIILAIIVTLASFACSNPTPAEPTATAKPSDAPTSTPAPRVTPASAPVGTPAAAPATPVQAAAPTGGLEFQLGFKMLAVQIADVVGVPIEYEHYGANGDSLQRTSKGLMVWRKADNWTAFTNGARTWINGPFGVAERSNDVRFDWESDSKSGATPTPRPTPPPFRPATVPLGEPRIVVTEDRQIEITVLEVVRNAEQQLRNVNPAAYDRLPPRANDEKVLIKLRFRYIDGPPGQRYVSDRVREYSFLQKNGAAGSVYPGVLPEPSVDTGFLSMGESKEGWIAAIVDKDVTFMMVFGRSLDQKVTFALQ